MARKRKIIIRCERTIGKHDPIPVLRFDPPACGGPGYCRKCGEEEDRALERAGWGVASSCEGGP